MALKTDNLPTGNPMGDPGAAGPQPAGGLWPLSTSKVANPKNMPVGPNPMPGKAGKPPFLK